MATPEAAGGPVTVIVTWRVRPGCEAEFAAWRREISAAALAFPGHLGIEVIHPDSARGEYVVIFRFDTYQHLRDWQESPIRRELLHKAELFRAAPPSYHRQSGLEYWFEPPAANSSPPRWKMATVTVLGVWPVSLLVSGLLKPSLAGQSLVLQGLVMAICIVILLTWVVMPALVRVLRPWLKPNRLEE